MGIYSQSHEYHQKKVYIDKVAINIIKTKIRRGVDMELVQKNPLFDDERLSLLNEKPPANPNLWYRFRLRQKAQVEKYITELIQEVDKAGPDGKKLLEQGLRFLLEKFSKTSAWLMFIAADRTFNYLFRKYPVAKKIVSFLLDEYKNNGMIKENDYNTIKNHFSLK